MIKRLNISTRSRSEFVDITRLVQEALDNSGVQHGSCQVFVPHTTAGVTINENADPDVRRDIMTSLDRLVPWQDNYHHSEGNSAAHIKASLMGFTVSIPVDSGRLVLGTWQCIYFCEFDGPRSRNVVVNITGGS
jgi:secondary thiamine-phosphate synthase enzyme